MIEISGRNVNYVLSEALGALPQFAIEEDSRNGRVMAFPHPMILRYDNPLERVLFWPARDANPFFHLMEALWMLNGQNDLAWPKYFNSKFGAYSDDGMTVAGAYGFRWRRHFATDQLANVFNLLKKDPTTRRAVIGMWDPYKDSAWGATMSKDVPCNTHVYFRNVFGALQMTVCNRSNDLIWGACGSNVVHFSMLQELLARALELDIGEYFQITNNLHIYDGIPNRDLYDRPVPYWECAYTAGKAEPYPLIRAQLEHWLQDLEEFMKTPLNSSGYYDPFFPEVAVPIMKAWEARKNRTSNGLEELEQCKATDWRLACTEWIQRREANAQSK